MLLIQFHVYLNHHALPHLYVMLLHICTCIRTHSWPPTCTYVTASNISHTVLRVLSILSWCEWSCYNSYHSIHTTQFNCTESPSVEQSHLQSWPAFLSLLCMFQFLRSFINYTLKRHSGAELHIYFLVHLESIYYEIFFYSKIVPNCAVAK